MKNLLTGLVIGALSSSAFATTWTVDDDGKADFNNIQAAVDAASSGDEIVVMPGIYTSTQDGHVVNTLGKAVTLRSSDPSNPDVVAATIIDGEGARRGIACFNFETNKTLIEGLTITNGFAVWFDYDEDGDIGWLEDDCGGGMYNWYSSPTVTNCTFTNNTGYSYGGGMSNIYSSPTLIDCTFTGNTGSEELNGGGMYNNGSSPTLENCIFTNNTAEYGGGMYNNGSSPTLENCIFTNNTAGEWGGGMYIDFGSSPTLAGCYFCGNTPDHIYGGYDNGGGNLVHDECQGLPVGGCCFGSQCVLTTAVSCSVSGGTYQGDGNGCDSNPCGEPGTGACCVTTGCLPATTQDCFNANGSFAGELVSCNDVACPTVCAADLDGDGEVKVADLLLLIAAWGSCP